MPKWMIKVTKHFKVSKKKIENINNKRNLFQMVEMSSFCFNFPYVTKKGILVRLKRSLVKGVHI